MTTTATAASVKVRLRRNSQLARRARGRAGSRGEGKAVAAFELLDADGEPTLQEQPELIGLPAVAGGLVGARVELQLLDQVLGATARAVDLLVERLAPGAGPIREVMMTIGWKQRVS
jgi:hypothetical protein